MSGSSRPRPRELKKSLTFIQHDSSDVKHPVYKGYMYKEAVGTFHTAFNRRYFALYKRYLVYYENEHDYLKDVQLLTLEHRHGAIRLDRLYLTKPDTKPKGGKYCFILHAPDKSNKRHEYLLVTKTREERREWMNKLQELNPKLVPLDAHIRPDTPLPGRKIRSDSFTPGSDQDPSVISSIKSTTDDDHHELELHEGDSDHEYHEPNEEHEHSNGTNHTNGDSHGDCVTISVPVPST